MSLSRGRQVGLAAGAMVIVAVVAGLGYWALRTDYDVLFANLSPQDAAAMTRELDQMKLPYRLGVDGSSILVDRHSVPETRLKLMGKDLPLSGAVGFEVFNNVDFGMTEFAQKVNYQRALQGELTRTILSIAEVETVRVHLALPDDGLFKRDRGRSKASVTLSLRHGQSLRREQVKGIQRLVAAAIPGIQGQDVTIISAQGVALTQDDADGPAAATSLRMELKKEVEQQLAQKANAVLEKAFGVGIALASVDVTLDMNQVKVTTEDVTTPVSATGEGPAGVVIRERETVRDSGRSSGDDAGAAGNVHRELDYQVGRRVEQLVSSPGSIARLHALAILRVPLNAAQLEQVQKLLANAVGALPSRGDTVVVQPLDSLAAVTKPTAASVVAPEPPRMPPDMRTASVPGAEEVGRVSSAIMLLLLPLALLLCGRWAWWRLQERQRLRSAKLSADQRQLALRRITLWLNEPSQTVERADVR